MEIQEYLEKMKTIQYRLLEYFDNDENPEDFNNLIIFLNDQKIRIGKHEFKSFINILVKISNNYSQKQDFFDKIFKILKYYKNDYQKYFSNNEIFSIFSSSKRLLLFLIEENIINVDETFSFSILKKYNSKNTFKKLKEQNYHFFFFPEIKKFIKKSKIEKYSKMIPDDFEEKRKIGENENYICYLIRKDMINEFIIYINKTNYLLKSTINPSIYETNQFLYNKSPTLIEYSAFFGSIKIFQYLLLQKVELKSSMIYAIHGNNAEIISLIEENTVDLIKNNYEVFMKEAIKCHHNEIANYFNANYGGEFKGQFLKSVKYSNFDYIDFKSINDFIDQINQDSTKESIIFETMTRTDTIVGTRKTSFAKFCLFDPYLVKLLIGKIDMNITYKTIIDQLFFFNKIHKLCILLYYIYNMF